MGDVRWDMLGQYPNAGQAFAQAFEQGQQRHKEERANQALNALLVNPDDQTALQAYGKYDPKGAMQFQQQQHRRTLEAAQAHQENIVKGAQIIRQMNPRDEQTWQAAKAMAAQAGIDVREVPDHFDPQYVQGLVHLADTFAPQKAEGTSMERNFEFLQGKDPKLADQYLHGQAEGPPMIASNGDGTFTIIPRSMAQQQQPQGAVPPPPPGFVIDGGPTPPASGDFR